MTSDPVGQDGYAVISSDGAGVRSVVGEGSTAGCSPGMAELMPGQVRVVIVMGGVTNTVMVMVTLCRWSASTRAPRCPRVRTRW